MEKYPRRTFFNRMADGLCGTALAYLLDNDLFASNPAVAGPKIYDLKSKQPHHTPRAKSVIQLFMNGGPSQVDLFDPKPALEKYAGQPPSRDLAAEVRAVRETGGLMPSPYKFAKHGQSGAELSEILPHLATCVDDMAIVRSMFTTHISHEASLFLIHGGRILPTRPTLGAWIVYGLGSENQNLPAYVVLDDPKGPPVNFIQNWQAGSPPCTKGRVCGPKVHPSSTCSPRKSTPAPSSISAGACCAAWILRTRGPIRVTRNWKPASPTTNSQRACRLRPLTPSTWTKRPLPRSACTECMTNGPLPMDAAA